MLTRSDFGSAVKEAPRHYARADLLAGNPLLHAQLLTRAGPATLGALKALLAETAETLFASERDQRLHRVLDLTYFNPAPKQEAAAERLGMSSPAAGCRHRPADRLVVAAGANCSGIECRRRALLL